MLDALILGQGVLGSLLALRLIADGKRVLVLDNAHLSSASLIAAGIMNPVSGTRLARLWETDTEREFTIDAYRVVEKQLGVSFLRENRLIRSLSTELELASFKRRQTDSFYAADCQPLTEPDRFQAICDLGEAQYESPSVFQVRAPILLSAVQSYLLERDAYQRVKFDHDELVVAENSVSWQGIQARTMLFCEGAKAQENPFFQDLEWKTSIGDVLEISTDELPEKTILNHGKWLCPTSENWFKYGSTAYWEDTHYNQTDSVDKLKASLKAFLNVPYTIQSSTHGERPSLRNRKPIARFHDTLKPLAILNGLGGRGLAVAPHLVDGFVKTNFS